MSSLLKALFTGTSKHKKLSEEWATMREPMVEGVTFHCKYLGSTLVDDPKGEAATAEAIKRIIHTAKQGARKPERVALQVSLQGIRMEDCTTKEVLLQTSIYKISYCSADAHYDHVFAFIATTDNETCECHAYLCPKRKMAQAVTLSIAQAFNVAYECWKMSLSGKENSETYGQEELPAEVMVKSTIHTAPQSQPSSQGSSPIPIRSDFGSSDMSTSGYQSSNQALLIDLDDSSEYQTGTDSCQAQTKRSMFSKPLSTIDDLDDISDGFSRLALRRGNPPQPMNGRSRLGLADLGLAAFTDHPAAIPTGNGSWLSTNSTLSTTSPNSTQPTSPVAASPPDPWAELGQSPPESWECFSRSPNSAFLHSCQSPPSSGFNGSLASPPLQSFMPPQSPQSPPQLDPLPFPPFLFTAENDHSREQHQFNTNNNKVNGAHSQPNVQTRPEITNPFLLTSTNPFVPVSPVREVASSNPPQGVECTRVLVGPGSAAGCSPRHPKWIEDFSGAESKNVMCS